jgi:D-amino-acid dehydrogenase
VLPSLAPSSSSSWCRWRHCNARDFRVGLETHLRLAEDANDLFDDYLADGIEFEMHPAGVQATVAAATAGIAG